MAISLNLNETPYGIPIKGAYARISMGRLDKTGMLLQISHYASEKAAKDGSQPLLDSHEFAPLNELSDGSNPLAMAYNWLKCQPKYAEAKDI